MNNKQKEVLHKYKHFLAKNITWSNELANQLVSHGVITEIILKNLQNHERDNKQGKKTMVKLLEILPLRGSAAFERFCEILYLHGYPFIADFLKDEENSNAEIHDIKELYKRLPVLEKALKDYDRKILEAFVNEKVTEIHLKDIWRKEAIAKEKYKAIDAKQRQLEEAFQNEDKLKAKGNEIKSLENMLSEARNDITELKSKLEYMRKKLRESEDKFGVQMKFNMANEHVINKLQSRCERSEMLLKSIESKLKNTMQLPERNSERDQMAVLDFPFSFLEEEFGLLISRYVFLLETEKQYDQLLQERNHILAHLGNTSGNEYQNMFIAYRDFAVKTDEDLMNVKEQLQKHNHIIEGQQEIIQILNQEVDKQMQQTKHKHIGTVWQTAMISVMRKQLHDVKYDNRIKDTRIKYFENEISKMKSRISEFETAIANDVPVVTDHFHQDPLIKERNHLTLTNQIDDVSDADSVIAKYEAKHGRNSLLPPLAGRLLTPTTDTRHIRSHSPNRYKPKQKPTWSVPKLAAQEGLVTHQLKLEKRGNFVGKILDHGIGNLRPIHGKIIKHSPAP